MADRLLEALDGFDHAIDQLQGAVAQQPTREQRTRIVELRRQLAEMRRVVVPQRWLFAPGTGLPDSFPHLDPDSAPAVAVTRQVGSGLAFLLWAGRQPRRQPRLH